MPTMDLSLVGIGFLGRNRLNKIAVGYAVIRFGKPGVIDDESHLVRAQPGKLQSSNLYKLSKSKMTPAKTNLLNLFHEEIHVYFQN